ncbi:MAG: hypothetical protein QOJ22_119 [Thermoleophilaceae bacterium]|jgi:hypothetical protein|nr:hypothetical protein [Thermoleophilaceae bacterium]
MSAPPGDPQPQKPTSRAAELAAEQVESIVAAAMATATKLTSAAKEEAASAKEEAASVRALAREAATNEIESAQREASARIREAQAAADDVLAEAKAVSGGMRQLADLLTTHAERILRDVQNSHRAISAELRAAGSGPADTRPEGEPGQPRAARRSSSAGDNPFADLEPPDWVEDKREAR